MDVKPGYLTTEFWVSLIGPVVALLVVFGVIGPDQADTLAQALVQVVLALFAAGAAIYPIVEYIKSRARVKEAASLATAQAEVIYVEREE